MQNIRYSPTMAVDPFSLVSTFNCPTRSDVIAQEAAAFRDEADVF